MDAKSMYSARWAEKFRGLGLGRNELTARSWLNPSMYGWAMKHAARRMAGVLVRWRNGLWRWQAVLKDN